MQREIKFRAWDVHLEVMLYDISISAGGFPMSSTGEFLPENWDVKRWPVMQFTGLRDKNGKEIYEGDVIKHYMGDSLQDSPSEVRWNDDGGWSPWLEYSGDSYTRVSDAEVIGNIYENPELLLVKN